jgi:HSP20 family protein
MANLERRNGNYGTWDPFGIARELLRWDPTVDTGPRTRRAETFAPRFEVKATDDAYVLHADLPGVKDEDVEVTVHGNVLTVRGERRAEERKEGETFYVYERSYGGFERSFTLPEEADGDRIEARLADGVLAVRIAKRAESKPRKISLRK